MGFTRKMFIVSTGGLGRAVVNPNSKKARTAKATEKQLKLQKQALKAEQKQQAAAFRAQQEYAQRQLELQKQLAWEAQQQQIALQAPPEASDQPVVIDAHAESLPATPLIADELAKLADLRDRGVLTDQEFAERKARLLSDEG